MPRLALQPFSLLQGSLDAYVQANFTRIENVFDVVEDVKSGQSLVTGSLTLNTGLTTVTRAIGGLLNSPVAGGCFITITPGTAGLITVRVFSSTFVLSTVPTQIQWIAIGVLSLS